MVPVIDVHEHIFRGKDIPLKGYLLSRAYPNWNRRAVHVLAPLHRPRAPRPADAGQAVRPARDMQQHGDGQAGHRRAGLHRGHVVPFAGLTADGKRCRGCPAACALPGHRPGAVVHDSRRGDRRGTRGAVPVLLRTPGPHHRALRVVWHRVFPPRELCRREARVPDPGPGGAP